MRESLLRPYRMIYYSILSRLVMAFITAALTMLGSILLQSADYSITYRYVRIGTYMNSVVVLITGLIIFFALTELRASSLWFARSATWFVIEAAINALFDLSGAALLVSESRFAEGAGKGSVLTLMYALTMAAAVIAPLFMNLFMYGYLLRGYQEVRSTCGKEDDHYRGLQRVLRAACCLLIAGAAAIMLVWFALRPVLADSRWVLLLCVLALGVGDVLLFIAEIRILRATREMKTLVEEISF